MGLAFRYFRSAVAEVYYDPFRTILINVRWFVPTLPALLILLILLSPVQTASTTEATLLEASEDTAALLTPAVLAVPAPARADDPGRSGHCGALQRDARFCPRRATGADSFPRRLSALFLVGVARLAATNVAAGTLLLLNAWFYLTIGIPGVGLLAPYVFFYLLVVWFALQPYLFPLLVEFDQPVRRIWRNAFFLVMDNLGLTLGLLIVRGIVLLVAGVLFIIVVPLFLAVLLAYIDNRAVTEAIDRYREAGRVFS